MIDIDGIRQSEAHTSTTVSPPPAATTPVRHLVFIHERNIPRCIKYHEQRVPEIKAHLRTAAAAGLRLVSAPTSIFMCLRERRPSDFRSVSVSGYQLYRVASRSSGRLGASQPGSPSFLALHGEIALFRASWLGSADAAS